MRTPHDDKIDAFLYAKPHENNILPQLYEIEEPEEEPAEEWPKENPHLIKPLPLPEPPENLLGITPEDRAELEGQYAKIIKARDEMCELLRPIYESIVDVLKPILNNILETLRPICEAIGDVMEQIIDLYPNKRVIYLSKHGKNKRIRKKNITRILKYFEREANKRPEFAQN